MKQNWISTLCLSWFVAFTLGNGVPAQDRQELNQSKLPLEQLLNRDGTLDLNKGVQGRLDPTGWQMMPGPNGEPRFVPDTMAQQTAGSTQFIAVPGDENWDDRFALPGLNRDVYAIALNGSEAYVGGWFNTAGGVVANGIAKWDGTSWSALGSGINGWVYAIAVSGSEVYVGGWFKTAGGVVANGIAKWDGMSWSALGSGISGDTWSRVVTIVVSGSEVYVGGDFSSAGGVAANGIAKWDGASWSALGSGLNSVVYAIAVSGRDVYAGGYITAAEGVDVKYIAKWDGTNWSMLGSGINGWVYAIAVSGSEVYAGGQFTAAGRVEAKYIAKWDGTSWSALGSGMNGNVFAIAISGSEVYAGGEFTTAGAVQANRLAKWDGTDWSALGSGMNDQVKAIAISDGEVYAGGEFTIAGGAAANGIAKWNGTSWFGLNALNKNGVNGSVSTLAISGIVVYAGGSFTTAGAVAASCIAKWDGTSWSALGSGMNGSVLAIAVNGSDLYAGGNFNIAGEVVANRIAKWDGTSWSALGDGVNGLVKAIAISGSEVYAAGQFTTAGAVVANHIAKWDGTNWSALGSGINEYYSSVHAIAVSGSDVYAGGYFTTAGGVAANRIAKWDGTSWSALGSGMNGYVSAIAVSGSDVYAGGWFTVAGGIAARGIARWDGTSWFPLGNGLDNSGDVENENAWAIAINGSDVYAGGVFVAAGGVPAKKIAKWDGTNWSALGSGVNGDVFAVAASGSEVYAGGVFTIAGGKPSSYFGRYAFNAPPAVTAGGPYRVNEGGSVTLTALGTDPDGGPLTYTWDLNNDGSFETAGQSVTFSAADIDGPAICTIQVQVTDNGGLTATDQTTVNVLNVTPTATFTVTPNTIIVGQSATLAFSNQADPSTADVTAGLAYSYDATNDGTFEVSDVASTSYTCPYLTSGTFTVKGRIKDKDGGFTDYTVEIVVQTPQEATGSLIDQVQSLIDAGILNEGQGNALISKLEAVIKQLGKGNTTPAINDLEAFINQVEAFMNSKPPILTQEQGQPLIDAANAIIAALNNPQLTKAGFQTEAREGLTSADQTNGLLPTGFQLEQNTPNPFNSITTIQFAVPRESYVRLKVYNAFGAEVATLVDQRVAAGTYKINWDASHLATGLYFSRLEAEGFAQTRKLLLMK